MAIQRIQRRTQYANGNCGRRTSETRRPRSAKDLLALQSPLAVLAIYRLPRDVGFAGGDWLLPLLQFIAFKTSLPLVENGVSTRGVSQVAFHYSYCPLSLRQSHF